MFKHQHKAKQCYFLFLTNLCMLWKPQDLWEEENALEKNPALTGYWLLRWYTNLGVRLALFVAPGVVGCLMFFLRNTFLSCMLA